MRPRIHIPLSPSDRKVTRTWAGRMLAVYAFIAAAIVGYSMINPGTTTVARNAGEERQARADTCEGRDAARTDAVTTSVSRDSATRQTRRACPPAAEPGVR